LVGKFGTLVGQFFPVFYAVAQPMSGLGPSPRPKPIFDLVICYVASCVPYVLVQQNVDGSDFFNRSWAEFKAGFKNKGGNRWLGNERLHQLTISGRYKLRFDLYARDNGSWYYAEYSRFVVSSEASNYKMHVSGYSGNAGDALWYSDGMMFTTYDRDNDQRSSGNCAVSRGGGFWHKNCVECGVNVARGRPGDFTWHGRVGTGRVAVEVQSTQMWLVCYM